MESTILTDKELARLHSAYTTRSAVEVANAVFSIDGVMTILKRMIKTRADLTEFPKDQMVVRSSIQVNTIPSSSSKAIEQNSNRDSPKRKVYTCETCGYSSIRRGDYNKHILIHTDIRPHQCPLCNYKTTEKCRLNRHMASKLHTGKPRLRRRKNVSLRIQCDRCAFSTDDSEEMIKHKNSCHQTELEQYTFSTVLDSNIFDVDKDVVTVYTLDEIKADVVT